MVYRFQLLATSFRKRTRRLALLLPRTRFRGSVRFAPRAEGRDRERGRVGVEEGLVWIRGT